jgi:THO complex subunit 1
VLSQATTSIDDPGFVTIWNLFDILSILSDFDQCDPALLFWLTEELIESQTISGCRKVFDYLESRRERITAKHFKSKQLVILRTCNELLRRLSRALDPAFCGRVFIFMFQSFPLGDKSSVNLRGEYHVENVTTFDRTPSSQDKNLDAMDVDSNTQTTMAKKPADPKATTKSAAPDAKQAEKPLDPDDLYPIFWSMQDIFREPKKLFDAAQLGQFKAALESTMLVFTSIKTEPRAKDKPDRQADNTMRSLKRKLNQKNDDDLVTAFNPKYLTSRDLFRLEVRLFQGLHCLPSLPLTVPPDNRSLVSSQRPCPSSDCDGISASALLRSEENFLLNYQDAKQVRDVPGPGAQG